MHFYVCSIVPIHTLVYIKVCIFQLWEQFCKHITKYTKCRVKLKVLTHPWNKAGELSWLRNH